MMARDIALTLLFTVAPITELRFGIPFGIGSGLNPWLTFLMAVIANAAVFFPIYFALPPLYRKLLWRIPLFSRYLDRVRTRGKPKVDRYGPWGLVFFVAIPLPVTGVYTATALAWLLGMDWRKAFPPIAIGVVIAGIIMLLGTLGVVEIFRIFVKN